MRRTRWMTVCSLVASAALCAAPWQARAEEEGGDGAKAEGAKAEGGKDADGGNRGDRGNRGGRRGGPGGQGGPGGPGGFGGGWGRMARGGTDFMKESIARAVGGDTAVKLDTLPYSENRNLVNEVPVGGVDGLSQNGTGWKVEEVFTTTEEQTKALSDLRTEYKTELEAIQKKLDEVHKTYAAQIVELRKKYELKANDVLTGDAKGEKQKLDEIAASYAKDAKAAGQARVEEGQKLSDEVEKSIATARENQNFDGMGDLFGKLRDFQTSIRTAVAELEKSGRDKMKEAVTGESKTKLTELLKGLEDRENRMRNWGGGGDRGGQRGQRGGPQGGEGAKTGNGGPVAPPKEGGEF